MGTSTTRGRAVGEQVLAVDAPTHESDHESDFTDVWRPDWPLDVRRVLSRDRRGTGDPTLRYAEDGVWRTATTAAGPATVHLAAGAGAVRISAWGPGAVLAGQ